MISSFAPQWGVFAYKMEWPNITCNNGVNETHQMTLCKRIKVTCSFVMDLAIHMQFNICIHVVHSSVIRMTN